MKPIIKVETIAGIQLGPRSKVKITPFYFKHLSPSNRSLCRQEYKRLRKQGKSTHLSKVEACTFARFLLEHHA